MKLPAFTDKPVYGANTAVHCDSCGLVGTFPMREYTDISLAKVAHTLDHALECIEEQQELINAMGQDINELWEFTGAGSRYFDR